jgi:hypothetical protein
MKVYHHVNYHTDFFFFFQYNKKNSWLNVFFFYTDNEPSTLLGLHPSSFSINEFWACKGLLDCTHEHIHLKWVANLNDSNETLVFIVNNEKIWAMHMDPISK